MKKKLIQTAILNFRRWCEVEQCDWGTEKINTVAAHIAKTCQTEMLEPEIKELVDFYEAQIASVVQRNEIFENTVGPLWDALREASKPKPDDRMLGDSVPSSIRHLLYSKPCWAAKP